VVSAGTPTCMDVSPLVKGTVLGFADRELT
jgi:hypothetical protein